MLGDAHSTNWAENFQFFINENNPTNFERIWQRAYLLYRRIGSIAHRPVPFDQVMDFSIIQKLGQDAKYASSKVEYETKVAPKDLQAVRAEGDEILTNTVVIHFFPNSWDPFNTVSKTVNGKAVEELYDPNVEQRAGRDRPARRPVRHGTHHHRRPHRQHHERPGARRGGQGSFAQAGQRHQGSSAARSTPILMAIGSTSMAWAGTARSIRVNQSKNRRVEIKVLTAEKAN